MPGPAKHHFKTRKGGPEILDFNTASTAIHLLFLVESLLLKKELPLIAPGARPRKMHLLVEEVRPRGTGAALKAAGLEKL